MTLLVAIVLGLVVGSFLNVCIHRIPHDESLWGPRSRCPRCRKPIAAYDNVPVLSFVVLRGRCRDCGKRISARYPTVELLTAALFAALALRWPGRPGWVASAWTATSALIVVAFIDWDTFLIPDVLSYGLAATGLLAAPLNPLFAGGPWARLAWAAAGAAFGFLLCWGVAAAGEAVFKKEAMGGGDVKLLAGVGAWTGALGAFDCLIVASMFGSLYGGALLLRGRLKRQDPIPFGPFLSAAAIFNLFYLLPFGFPFTWTAQAAEEPPAAIAAARGEITLRPAGADHFDPLESPPGRRLDPGDAVATASSSAVHLALPVGAVALVPPESVLVFLREGTRPEARLERGRVLIALPRSLDRGWSFTLRARAAAATAEDGGAFWAAVDPETGDGDFGVLRGRLSVAAEGRHVRLKSGQRVHVRYGGELGEPVPGPREAPWSDQLAIDGGFSGAEHLLRQTAPGRD